MPNRNDFELILTLRRRQPADYRALPPDVKLKALEHEAGKREADEMKRTETHTLEPGERSEFWEQRLAWRDSQDPRWLKSMSQADRAAALAYERNRDGKRVAV